MEKITACHLVLLCVCVRERDIPSSNRLFGYIRFCEPLLESFKDEKVCQQEMGIETLESSGGQEDKETSIIKWMISKSHKGAHILRKLFSQFVKEIVEGMIGYIRVPAIMSKLLSDNGGQEFGNFKVTILGMLGTYGFERRILVHLPLFSSFMIVILPSLVMQPG